MIYLFFDYQIQIFLMIESLNALYIKIKFLNKDTFKKRYYAIQSTKI